MLSTGLSMTGVDMDSRGSRKEYILYFCHECIGEILSRCCRFSNRKLYTEKLISFI